MDKVADGDFSVRLEYRGSEPMMRHVWDNLIGNAVKFSPPGGAVRLRLEKKLTKTIFTVEDTGPGAAEKMRLQIERGSKMAKGYIIFTPLAGGGKCKKEVAFWKWCCRDRWNFFDMTHITNYAVFLGGLAPEDYLIIAGGDGTLNRFVQDTEGITVSQSFFISPRVPAMILPRIWENRRCASLFLWKRI